MGLLSALFGKTITIDGNGEEALTRAINEAYIQNGTMVYTNVPWEEAECFIISHGKQVNYWEDGGVSGSVYISVDGNRVQISLSRHRAKGTTIASYHSRQ